jgi:hypothetical protein
MFSILSLGRRLAITYAALVPIIVLAEFHKQIHRLSVTNSSILSSNRLTCIAFKDFTYILGLYEINPFIVGSRYFKVLSDGNSPTSYASFKPLGY